MWQSKLWAAVQTKDLSRIKNITANVIQCKQSMTETIVSSLEVQYTVTKLCRDATRGPPELSGGLCALGGQTLLTTYQRTASMN